METIRLLAATLESDAIAMDLQKENGERIGMRLPMADFILLRLQLDLQTKPVENLSSPLAPKQLQVIEPQSLTVSSESLSGDPVLSFGLGKLGDLAVRIPRKALPGVMQTLLPYLSPTADSPKN
jgi:hypothetical protein